MHVSVSNVPFQGTIILQRTYLEISSVISFILRVRGLAELLKPRKENLEFSRITYNCATPLVKKFFFNTFMLETFSFSTPIIQLEVSKKKTFRLQTFSFSIGTRKLCY